MLRLRTSTTARTASREAVLALPITLASFGLHALYFPGGPTNAPTVSFGTTRIHDWNGNYLTNGGCFAVGKWCNIETAQGNFDWADADAFVAAHAGRDIVWTMDGTPAWAVASPGSNGFYKNKAGTLIPGSNMPPDNLARWSAWATALATRYQTSVRYYEVWNEPEFPGAAGSYWAASAAQMGALMRLAYQAIKAVSPSLQVISPSISTLPDRLGTLLAASDGATGSAAQWFDILGFHPYASGGGALQMGIEHLATRIDALRALLAAHGRSGVPIWSTEHGVPGGALASASDAQRRRWLRKYFGAYFALGVERAMFYAYDSGSMGLHVPANTGTTYDMRPAWSEMLGELVGRTVVGSRIEGNNKNGADWSIRLYLNNGAEWNA